MTRLATTILIFGTIRQSLDHSHQKNQKLNNLKLGIADYDKKIDQAQSDQNMIDKETQDYCFQLTLLFFLDFISAWFDQYSKYFAGRRYDKVSSTLETLILKIYDNKFVFITTGLLSELFMIGQYMKFFHSDFMGAKPLISDVCFVPLVAGLMVKNLINVVELKQGMYRIVDFDVEEKAEKMD